MKSLFFHSFFYGVYFFSLTALAGGCRDISSYLIEVENPYFHVIKLDVGIKKGAYRSRELMVALTKSQTEKSWFRVLTLIKKPLVDSPSCNL
ncbi:MAG: hypothetical protein ACRDB7_02670 [Fusobacteriaceae bacterium]